MENANFFELAVAYYKDRVNREIFEKFHAESLRLLETDAEARRIVARENILAMANLQIALEKFKFTSDRLSDSYGSVEAIDEYIRKIEIEIKRLSYQKNHIR